MVKSSGWQTKKSIGESSDFELNFQKPKYKNQMSIKQERITPTLIYGITIIEPIVVSLNSRV